MSSHRPDFFNYIDLRGTPCPLNFVRCRLALENLSPNDLLKVDIDRGEPELMVLAGLRDAGHNVEVVAEESNWLTLKVSPCVR